MEAVAEAHSEMEEYKGEVWAAMKEKQVLPLAAGEAEETQGKVIQAVR